ncbi:MAG: class II aldolase/adducin family protein [Thiohalophilus sp.]
MKTSLAMHLKDDLIRHYQWLRQYGINDSHSGNASVREGNTIWLTPTGACADTLEANQLIACDIDGTLGDGASLDARLHVMVYQKNERTRAVLHGHGAHTVALTLNGKDFTPPDFEGHYYFGTVPVLSIAYENYLAEAPEQVSDVLARHKITVVRGHGVYAQAETINLAYKWNCSLELSAQTAWLAQQAGTLPG